VFKENIKLIHKNFLPRLDKFKQPNEIYQLTTKERPIRFYGEPGLSYYLYVGSI